MILYNQLKKLPQDYIDKKIKEFLNEDIPDKDFTSFGTVDSSIITKAIIEAQGDTIFVGEHIISSFFDENDFKLKINFRDGDEVHDKDVIAEIIGSAALILERERTLLNLLQRLCSVAAETRKYALKADGKIKVLDTRKTTPGLREFEKYAVAIGGGTNHRLNLSTGILIKDNHISAAGGVKNALQKINSLALGLPIELEVDNCNQIEEALEIGVDGFLLDNMSPETAKKAVELIRNSKNGNSIFIECSGGINYDTLEGYLETGIDAVSIGALTHSVKAAPIHMEFTNE